MFRVMNICSTSHIKVWILLIIIQAIWNKGVWSWKTGPPDGLPELIKLNVECGKEEMTINLEFSAPYEGNVYSKTNGQTERCIHVSPHSHITSATFSIEYNRCGTRSDPKGKYYENTIIIQYDDIVIEAWDEAKKIRCEWHDGYEKSAYKMPITISDLDVVEMNFQGDDVDCWLEVQDGKGPWSAKVDGLIPLGSPLTLVVAIQDSEGHFDMKVKSCIAHDGHKHPIYLTDDDGCVLRPKMMSSFQKTTDTKGTASVIAYSHFYAFKFPETVEVTIQCTVEICRHGCSSTCTEGRDLTPDIAETSVIKPPLGKDSDDIPTYKDSNPFSTVITSRPGSYNYSSSVNTSSSVVVSSSTNISSEYKDPLKSSGSNTHHSYYANKYPYDLFDVILAEKRQDVNVDEYNNYDDAENHDNLHSENKDDIYYAQNPNFYHEDYGYGKTFPIEQDIHKVLEDGTNITESDPLKNETTESNESLPQPMKLEEVSIPTESLMEETESRERTQSEMSVKEDINLSTSTTVASSILNDVHSTDLHDIETSTTLAYEILSQADSSTTTITYDGKDTERSSHSIESITSKDQLLGEQYLYTEIAQHTDGPVTEELQTGDDHKSRHDYEESREDSKEQSSRKIGLKTSDDARSQEMDYDEFLASARKSLDNAEMKRNFRHKSFKPFKLPPPVPPLTLYNGVPLHYYNHPNTKVEFRESHFHNKVRPYHYEYVKSKLRSPGRIRKRREIGENEQLGLKQTLRVIAPSDIDFASKDDKKLSFHVGKNNANNDLCLTSSSFAAGLSLLLLANICVLCVVAFLGHHYYIHRKSKVQTIELLSTEMSS